MVSAWYVLYLCTNHTQTYLRGQPCPSSSLPGLLGEVQHGRWPAEPVHGDVCGVPAALGVVRRGVQVGARVLVLGELVLGVVVTGIEEDVNLEATLKTEEQRHRRLRLEQQLKLQQQQQQQHRQAQRQRQEQHRRQQRPSTSPITSATTMTDIPIDGSVINTMINTSWFHGFISHVSLTLLPPATRRAGRSC